MIRVVVTTEQELAHLWARHDFAPLFNMPYKVFRQHPNGQLETIGGGGVTNTSHHNGPAPAVAGGGPGGTGTATVKTRKRRK